MAIADPAVGDRTAAAWADAITDRVNAGGFYGDQSLATTVTLATAATNVAATASVTFTLTEQRRVRIVTSCQFLMASGTDGRYRAQSAYNTGATVAIGSVVLIGVLSATAIQTINDISSTYCDGTALLAAGTYTAYCAVQRNTGGGATDTARSNYVAVYDVGAF